MDCAANQLRRLFDASGRRIEERYYGIEGEPVTQKVHGFMKITWVYREGKAAKLCHKSLHSKGVPVDRETLINLSLKCKTPAMGHGVKV